MPVKFRVLNSEDEENQQEQAPPNGGVRFRVANPYQSARPAGPTTVTGGDAFLSGLGDSLSFGWGDEGLGIVKGLGGMLSGEDFWDVYDKSVKESRDWQKWAQEDEAGLYFGGEMAGALLGGLGAGAGVRGAAALANLARGARAGATTASAAQRARQMGLLSRMGRAAVPAMAGGALYGAGASDGGENGDMLLNAALGGVIGGAAGPLLLGVGAGAKKAFIDPFTDLDAKAAMAKRLAQQLDFYEMDAGKIAQNAKELTDVDPVNTWVMDVMGPFGADAVKASSAAATPKLAAMEAAAKARNAAIADGASERLKLLSSNTSKNYKGYVHRVTEIDKELSDFDSVYKAIDAQELDMDGIPEGLRRFVEKNAPDDWAVQRLDGQVKNLTDKPSGLFKEAMQAAVEVAGAEFGGAIPAKLLMSKPAFWRTLLTQARKAKEGAWQRGDTSLGERMGVQYKQLQQQLGELLGDDWVKAQNRYAALNSERDALEFGFKAITKTDAVGLADDLKLFNRMSPREQVWARQGMVSRLIDNIRSQETRASTRDMLRKVADNPLQKDTLVHYFGGFTKKGVPDKRWTRLQDTIEDLDKRYTFFDNIQRSGILGGSKTASVLTRAADQSASSTPAIGELLKGDVLSALRKAFVGDLSERFDQEVANEIIDFMMKPARITDATGRLVGGLEHEIAQKGLKGWLNGPSLVQKALKRQAQMQKAYLGRWGEARSMLYAGVGGGAGGAELVGLE